MSEHDGADDGPGKQGAESEDDGPGDQRGEREHEGPGGGPKRVVSNTSVDDILNSLNETNAGDSNPRSADATRAQSNPPADSRGQLEGEVSFEEAEESEEARVENAEEEGTGNAEEVKVENADGTDGESEQTQIAEGADGKTEPEQAHRDESTVSTPTQDDLSSRVERGAVTGADVRAAEAGESRERTPDIDEIDLSLDDLETRTPSESEVSGSTVASTSNQTDDPAPSSGEADDRPDSNGLLARLRNLFSQ
ncbi:hypothetical protein [Natronosalvus halobius]|uniref:hypothetical protein n=1 Tax=Natronosalvus halobius TaxID=2953746 RepID=UPI00209E2716|nr:hypothetical protein [Natronosalvus halobius]USZ72613.1 hypothetical protein NGM15_04665 [Natronosalvus halobius]